MANPLCAVDDCTRYGRIELDFPGEHTDKLIVARYEHRTMICEYHASMAQEIFAERGVFAPIDVRPRRKVIINRTGDQRRYTRRKVVDNTE